ncbi:hypothetical protein LSH36_55g07059 [Paralvinella palmiformis]|uniref:E3 ubiquitin-protein ligase CHFR cysteine rich domain-containing protein n=1 Tax=Paralvinella palmiformis TaxID=53620 RepID=A0AAD9K545_9ANNE|nr:hypothetical protein LSH36_55g07059 [Paralvinella palmiformis]
MVLLKLDFFGKLGYDCGFQNYLEQKGINIKDVITVCLSKLDDGSYTCMDQARGLNSSTVLCYHCGLRNLRDLAYQYRKDIPNDELPGLVVIFEKLLLILRFQDQSPKDQTVIGERIVEHKEEKWTMQRDITTYVNRREHNLTLDGTLI